MNDLNEAIEQICRLKGEALGMQCMIIAILRSLSRPQLEAALQELDQEEEAARVLLLNSDQAGEHVLHGFEQFFQAVSAIRR